MPELNRIGVDLVQLIPIKKSSFLRHLTHKLNMRCRNIASYLKYTCHFKAICHHMTVDSSVILHNKLIASVSDDPLCLPGGDIVPLKGV